MKSYLLSFMLLIITVFAANAQTANAIIFSENGEKFIVILNGVLQNQIPSSNVKLTNLNAEWFKMKIQFSDLDLGTKEFNLNVSLGNERSIALHRKNDGDYGLRMTSETPIMQAPPTQNGQTEVVFNSTPNSTTVSSQTTTTTVGNANPNGNVTMGMNMNGAGVGINMSGMDMNQNSSSTTITTTTTTTSSGNMDASPPAYQPSSPPPAPEHYNMPGYNGPIGCPYPMSREDFHSAKESISSKSFEDSKMTVAKQIIVSNCLTCSQVKEIMMLFSFENTKLDFAKYAYGYTFDLGNYYKLNDAFTFSSSIDDLNKYIENHKR